MKAISSYKVYLCTYAVENNKYKYTKLIEIKGFPDMGGTPEMLDCTTTSDGIQCFIPGIQMLNNEGLEFTANYTKANYKKLTDRMDAEKNADGSYALVYGGTLGSDDVVTNDGEGAFLFKGKLNGYPKGGEVNSVVDLGISIAPSTTIEFVENEDSAILDRDSGESLKPKILSAYRKTTKGIITARMGSARLQKVVSTASVSAPALGVFPGISPEESILIESSNNIPATLYVVDTAGNISDGVSVETDDTQPEVVLAADGNTIKITDGKSGIHKVGDTVYSNYPKEIDNYPKPATALTILDAVGNSYTYGG